MRFFCSPRWSCGPSFFDATLSGVFCLVRHAGILRKLPLPPSAVPLSVVLRSLLDLGMNMVAVFILVAVVGLSPQLAWLELIPLIALVTAFALAVVLLVSALYVRFRDIDQIWQVGSQMLFYASGIFFVITALPDDLPAVMVPATLLVAGLVVFRRMAPRAAENL